MEDIVIGLDLGTTSVKAVAFDLKGKVMEESEKFIQTYYPEQDFVEQKPDEIEKSSRKVLKDIFEASRHSNILGVGISCAMHSLICMKEDGTPLSDMIIWSDGRSSGLVERLDPQVKKSVYSKTGTPIHPMSPLLKLMWMKENNDKAYQQADYFMSMKEYLLYKWFDKRMVDYSMASATGLMNVKALDWEEGQGCED